jgi:hypothetical protein
MVETILTHIKKPAPKLRDMMPGLNTFWGNNEKDRLHYVSTWSGWFDAFKAVGTNFSSETREQFRVATVAVFHLYTPFFHQMINSLILYLRHQAVYPNNFTGEEIPEYYLSSLRLLSSMENPTMSAILAALAKGNAKEMPAAPLAPAGWTSVAGFAQAVTFLAPSLANALPKANGGAPSSDIEAAPPPPAIETTPGSPSTPKV